MTTERLARLIWSMDAVCLIEAGYWILDAG